MKYRNLEVLIGYSIYMDGINRNDNTLFYNMYNILFRIVHSKEYHKILNTILSNLKSKNNRECIISETVNNLWEKFNNSFYNLRCTDKKYLEEYFNLPYNYSHRHFYDKDNTCIEDALNIINEIKKECNIK